MRKARKWAAGPASDDFHYNPDKPLRLGSRGTYTASVSTITADGVRADFSGWMVPLWDYATCTPSTLECFAFPFSIVPEARLGMLWTAATQALPGPNTFFSPGANAFLQASGCLADLLQPGGSHLVIDAQHNGILSVFGGFQQFALDPSKTRISTLTLYVDGLRIASKDVLYGVPYRP